MPIESPPKGRAEVRPSLPLDRVVELDVLRGFALLGILLVNILSFSGIKALGQDWDTAADGAVQAFIQFFVRTKFLSMFAILFGIGFAMQIARLEENARSKILIYLRRLIVLFGFGVLHLLLDPAEVLSIYAVCGVLLLLLRKVSVRLLIPLALVIMTLPYLHTAMVSSLPVATPTTEVAEETFESWDPYVGERPARVYGSGSFAEVLSYNLAFTRNRTSSWVGFLWMSVPLPLMLIGAYIGRREILQHISEKLPLIRKTLWLGLASGIVGTWSGFALIAMASADGWDPWLAFVGTVVWVMAGWAMALGYGAGIVLLMQRSTWRRLLQPLQAVGRLALTNYLLQTVICTSLFYGFGLGWFGSLGPFAVTLVAVSIYSVQVAMSVLWVRGFRYGPAEWIWRRLTYLGAFR